MTKLEKVEFSNSKSDITPELSSISLSETEMMQFLAAAKKEDVFFDGEVFSKPIQPSMILTGNEALQFLGLHTNRKFNILDRSDYPKILVKFNKVIEQLNNIPLGSIAGFWNKIHLRVINRSNINQSVKLLNDDGTLSANTTPYWGDETLGGNLRCFVPEIKEASEVYRNYITILRYIIVDHDLQELCEQYGIEIPNSSVKTLMEIK